MNNSKNIGLVVLAAGESSRLGKPKQLVDFQGKPLLQHVLDCSSKMNFQTKVLVLGAHFKNILHGIDDTSFAIQINKDWRDGMAGSLRTGVQKSLELNADLKAIMILVSDQPFVSKELLAKMIELHETEVDIVACEYDGIIGVPSLFGKIYFDELTKLTEDKGARQILKNHKNMVKTVRFDKGIFDIDTPEDLQRLNEE